MIAAWTNHDAGTTFVRRRWRLITLVSNTWMRYNIVFCQGRSPWFLNRTSTEVDCSRHVWRQHESEVSGSIKRVRLWRSYQISAHTHNRDLRKLGMNLIPFPRVRLPRFLHDLLRITRDIVAFPHTKSCSFLGCKIKAVWKDIYIRAYKIVWIRYQNPWIKYLTSMTVSLTTRIFSSLVIREWGLSHLFYCCASFLFVLYFSFFDLAVTWLPLQFSAVMSRPEK